MPAAVAERRTRTRGIGWQRYSRRTVAVRLPVPMRALVLAAAIPLLFLHAEFQPSVSVGVGGTSVTAYLTDFAILVVVLAAVAVVARDGFAPLRPGIALWVAAGAFFVWLAFEVAWGKHHAASYPATTHAVTALKFLEYALLAPSVVVLLRTRRDVLAALWAFVVWSCCATAVGIAEFFGSSIGAKGTVGHRQASFLSSADFAALSAGALLVGVVAVGARRFGLPRALGIVALVTGTLGTIVAGAVASILGLATALVVLGAVLLARRELPLRRAAAVGAVALVSAAGVVAIRGNDLHAFANFLGAQSSPEQTQPTKVQTYAHRTLLVW